VAEPTTNGTTESKKLEHKKRKREETAAEVVAEPAPEPEEPELKKFKVVDGIEIPAPQPIIREKKKKESAKEVRERRSREKAEQGRQSFLENKKKALEEGTFDYEADEKKKKERELERMVKEELRRREDTGEFGPKLPHPSMLLKYEKEVEKELKRLGKVGDLELEKQMMHDKVDVSKIRFLFIWFASTDLPSYLASTATRRSNTRKRSTSVRSSSERPSVKSKGACDPSCSAKNTPRKAK
jgi:hypothetical protein